MTNKNEGVLLRVKKLKKYFPVKKTTPFQEPQYVKANDGITLDIFEGETVGLVGESGCGKSTLGRVLLQLYPQTGGATFYYGRSLEDVAPKYVLKTIKNLKSDVNSLEKNREIRRQCKARLQSVSDEKEQAKAQRDFDKIDAKIDEYFDTTVKIFGSLTLCEDLDKASEVMNRWYTVKGKMIHLQRKAALLKVHIDADEHDSHVKASKLNKEKSQLASLEKEIAELNKQLEGVQKEIDALKEPLKNHKKFERLEARRDTGIDLARLTDEEMRLLRTDLQIIFQDPYSSLNPRMTIGQLIGEALVTHGYYKEGSQKLTDYIVEIMEKCGLQGYMIHRYPHEFSGGQRQRIGIARALALHPKFVVCDEAVSALDVSIQSQVINLLKDLREEQGFTYLFISHDLGVVKYISDRIGVMYLGNLVELSETEKIFAHPSHPYTQALLAAIPTTDVTKRSALTPLEGDVPSPVNPPRGCKFHTRCNQCMDICKKEIPEWKEIEPGHFVACHLYDSIESLEEKESL